MKYTGRMDRSLLDLTDKVAVITGGSRGIGKAIAFAYAEHGADVVIASRKLDNCESVANEITEKTGRKTLAVGTHVGKWDECNALADKVLETFGRCDILVNNAGMSPLYENVTDITEEYYDKVSSVNLKGPFALSLRLGGHMVANDGGVILNISTVGSIRPSRNEVVYAMAKSGLNAMTVALPTPSDRRCGSTASCPAPSSPTSPRPGARRPSRTPTRRRWVAPATPRTSPAPRSSSPARRRPGSPAPACASTAAWPVS